MIIKKEKIILTWSGGKDSCLALYELIKQGNVEIASLLTTLTEDYDRISMHGVRADLLRKQAESIGIPLREVYVSKNGSNEEYELQMREALEVFKGQGIKKVAFGDIFLEDIRRYRVEQLGKLGMDALFPLWGSNTYYLANRFIELGFQAIVVCVDTERLHGNFSGREFNQKFINDLPKSVDPCGEHGEFHTFVYDGPIFKKRIAFSRGEIILRDNRFCYCDLVAED